jgi:CPA1 family monovalent cation:H+ antiporter
MILRRVGRDAAYKARFETRYDRERGRGRVPEPPTQKEIVLVGWTGMRGILTLAAAAAVPEFTSPGHLPFPGRPEIQAIALFVTLGTLLIQGTTVKAMARWLGFDLAGDRAADTEMRERARQIIAEAAAQPAADIDASFEQQRHALGAAVQDNRLTEETARALIEDIDLRQAAHHTGDPATP